MKRASVAACGDMPVRDDAAPAADLSAPGDDHSLDLPLEAPAPGLAADFVVDLTQLYLNDIGTRPLLTAAQELELARAMRAGEFAARQTLIERNLRLVVSIARCPISSKREISD